MKKFARYINGNFNKYFYLDGEPGDFKRVLLNYGQCSIEVIEEKPDHDFRYERLSDEPIITIENGIQYERWSVVQLDNIDQLKKEKLAQLKDNAGQLILYKYPLYKQMNYTYEKVTEDRSDRFDTMVEYIDVIRAISNSREIELNKLTTPKEVLEFDITIRID